MSDFISDYIKYHPVKTQRGLEILTGMVPWVLIFGIIGGSFIIPDYIAYFIIVFNCYWLYKSLQLAVGAIVGYLNVRANEKIDWMAKLPDGFKDLSHVVIIPNVKEPDEILERNVASLAGQTFPAKQVYVVLAMEDREGEPARERAKKIKTKFGGVFAGIIDTYHVLAPGESIGKHSNNTFAAKAVKEQLLKKGFDLKKIIVTTCDVDLDFNRQFLALLTYKFLVVSDPQEKFFQSILLAYNNLHRLPFMSRILNITGSINNMAALFKPPSRIMNYSTYSLSFALLDRVGYWDIDVIPEDWHLNLKSYYVLKGKLEVVPIYLPNYLDAAESSSTWKSYQNYYEQVKRWAWGVVDIPYAIKMFLTDKEIPLWEKFSKLTVALETHFLWGSSWFIITLGATVPTIINPVFARTTLGFNLSRVSGFILTICLVGVVTVGVIDIFLNPKKERKLLAFLHPFTYLQWAFLPIAGLFFSALPGLESETRLMLGKYMGYRVTEKIADKDKKETS